MGDYLISATAFDGTIDIIAADTTNISKIAKEYHNLTYISDMLLSKTMTASLLMANFMKDNKELLTLEINSNRECGKILSVVNANLDVRGYIDGVDVKLRNNERIEDKIGIDGYIKVVKDMGLREPYIGISNIKTGDIAKDLMYYYSTSEQIPTYIGLSHIRGDEIEGRDCGIMIQVMPNVDKATIKYIKDNMDRIGLFEEKAREGNTLEDIIIDMFPKSKLNFKMRRNCKYRCNCSREKMREGLVSLGKDEIEDMIKDTGEAILECHFCNRRYKFNEDELKDIISSITR